MSSRVSLSSDERANILREIRSADDGASVPVRSSKGGSNKNSGGTIKAPSGKRKRGRGLRRTIYVIVTLLVLCGGLFSAKILKVGQNVLNKDRSIFAQLVDLIIPGDRKLVGEKDGQINVLLAAIGGKGHEGENLTDTIMVAMIRPQEKKVALLSIPRDLFVRLPGSTSFTKINAINAYKENVKKGEGIIALGQKVEEISGLSIHYYARVDFTAFKQVVDKIGGVEVTVPVSFYDYWHKISFPAGTELMSGDRALSYVRARYVDGPEGGDFARAARQQHLLLAMREKIFSANTAFDIRAITGILDALGDNVATNFNLWELKGVFEMVRGIPKDNIHTAVLSTGNNGLLTGGTEILEGVPASVIRPRAGAEDYSQIKEFVSSIFTSAKTDALATPNSSSKPTATPATSPSATPSPSSSSPDATNLKAEKPTVEIRNGTNITGLASRTSAKLKIANFIIQTVGNTAKRDRTSTIVIDLTANKKPESLKTILSTLGISSSVSLPSSENSSKADFLILLGTDSAGSVPTATP
ncbi:MAG: LCP family protein [bacterium]|nr:LCP family protein [bacterium]